MKFIFVTYRLIKEIGLVMRLILGFIFFGLFYYGLYLYAPAAFETLVSWAAAIFEYAQGALSKFSETAQVKKP